MESQQVEFIERPRVKEKGLRAAQFSAPAGSDPTKSASVDEEILNRLASGKRDQAWRLFIKEYQTRLYNLCFRMLGNYDDAIDALQESYVQIDRSLPGFKRQSSLYTWAYRVSLNVILNFRKKRSNHNARHSGQEMPEISRPEDDPDKMCEEKYRKYLVHQALQKLPRAQRCPLIMHDLDGFSFAEIAEAVQSTPGAVKVKVFRARKTLEKILLQGQEVQGFENVGRFEGQSLKHLLS
ncbi:MAG: RNA polymerase subunit sigma-70 [Leptospiraceae bacterium]|nr:RNA polymerase subunit sigma-70 [Leptospiraceae bacterium]